VTDNVPNPTYCEAGDWPPFEKAPDDLATHVVDAVLNPDGDSAGEVDERDLDKEPGDPPCPGWCDPPGAMPRGALASRGGVSVPVGVFVPDEHSPSGPGTPILDGPRADES
jgi:hypothetical protein